MKLLLDTHILLWYLEGHAKLLDAYRVRIEDRHNQVSISAASLWEMTIKMSLGKLDLLDDLPTIETILRQQGMGVVPIQVSHLERLLTLPFHHRDPFDRLIIAQALAEDLTLVSDDPLFSAYSAPLLQADS